jgi:large subunit ribosomal protein L16
MLSPKKVKHRKQQKGNLKGIAYRGSDVSFGDFALQVTESGKVTARQIEAARMAITRHVKRAGKLWIRVFPGQAHHEEAPRDPHGSRQGQRRGVGRRRAARAACCTSSAALPEDMAREAFRLASHKLPLWACEGPDPRHRVV